QAVDQGGGAFGRVAAGAAGDRDVARLQGCEPLDRLPQAALRLGRLGREELERDRHVGQRLAEPGEPALGKRSGCVHVHATALRSIGAEEGSSTSAVPTRRAAQTTTVRGSPASRTGGSGISPAATNQPRISASVKPRRRWACSRRRNSSSWRAKSTT